MCSNDTGSLGCQFFSQPKVWQPVIGLALLAAASVLMADEIVPVPNPASDAFGIQGTYARGSVYLANDILALKSIDQGQWSGAQPQGTGQQRAIGIARAEIGFTAANGLRVAAFHRHDWRVSASRDTIDAFLAVDSGEPLDPGRLYQIDYRLTGFSADGLSVSAGSSISLGSNWSLRIGAGISALAGRRYKSERWDGTLIDDGAGTQTISVDMRKRDSALDVVGEGFAVADRYQTVQGRGFTSDFGAVVTHGEWLRVEWLVADLIGRMYWKNLPYQNLAGSATIGTGALGSILQGRQGRVTLTEDLHTSQLATLAFAADTVELSLTDAWIARSHHPGIGVSKRIEDDLSIGANYYSRFPALSLHVTGRHFGVRLTTDRSSAADRRVIGIELFAAVLL